MLAEHPVQSLTDTPTLLAMESAYARALRSAVGTPGFEYVEEPGLTRIASAVPTPWFNSVLQTRLPAAEQGPAIDRVTALYRSRGVPLLWRLGPASSDRESVSAHLRAAGFRPAPPSTAILGTIPALVELWGILPITARGVRVFNVQEYRRWFQVFSAAFGVPSALLPFFEQAAERVGFGPDAGVQNLLLEERGVPVACATTLWSPGEPFASVFNFAVSPDARRRGLGKYMLAYAALRLRRQGCPQIGQFSTVEGVPFYLRFGRSRRLGEFENWIRMP